MDWGLLAAVFGDAPMRKIKEGEAPRSTPLLNEVPSIPFHEDFAFTHQNDRFQKATTRNIEISDSYPFSLFFCIRLSSIDMRQIYIIRSKTMPISLCNISTLTDKTLRSSSSPSDIINSIPAKEISQPFRHQQHHHQCTKKSGNTKLCHDDAEIDHLITNAGARCSPTPRR
jgi:hypothetical protein